MIVVFPGILSARSFPFTPACSGQYTHRSFRKCQSGLPILLFTFCSKPIESVRMRAYVWSDYHHLRRTTCPADVFLYYASFCDMLLCWKSMCRLFTEVCTSAGLRCGKKKNQRIPFSSHVPFSFSLYCDNAIVSLLQKGHNRVCTTTMTCFQF